MKVTFHFNGHRECFAEFIEEFKEEIDPMVADVVFTFDDSQPITHSSACVERMKQAARDADSAFEHWRKNK